MKLCFLALPVMLLSSCLPVVPNVNTLSTLGGAALQQSSSNYNQPSYNSTRNTSSYANDSVENEDANRGNVPTVQVPNYDPSSYRVRVR